MAESLPHKMVKEIKQMKAFRQIKYIKLYKGPGLDTN